ncbi:putrescine hydroxycinnamoyltransferase 1-like [Oryza brachyantha]|uniref:putrescine hydroxycinnamoyltransferase 1-like n=1 Tax=Oryza brachyantha TaxID=4533 RepID=UPI001ADA2177|nr:putrescine hydroxycinnamoyltransferase 1-like [Oryza brachyantha]
MDSDVQVVESCLVAPCEETPRRALALSPLDLLLANRGHTPIVYFYLRNTAGDGGFFDVARMKTAMGKALVAFYPLAGRLTVDDDRDQLQIDCNAEGALFVVARCTGLAIDDFDGLGPSPELKHLFVPRVDASSPIMMAVQVTFLRCGGVALGTAVHHAAVDAIGAFHFFQTWSALCRDGDGAVVELPCHDRTLLGARSPPVVHPDALSVFCPTLKLCQAPSDHPVVSEVISFSGDQVAGLKNACGGGVSTFSAVSAHVWRCVCVARRLPADAKTRLTFPASIRRCMSPPLPSRYFGNTIIWLCAAGLVEDITSPDALPAVAGRISGAVRRMDDELARSAIDYFEMTLEKGSGRPSPSPPGNVVATDLRVVSWLRMPVYDVDFGWGKPTQMQRAESERGGFVYLINGDDDGGGGGMHMVVCMEAANLMEFKRQLYTKL